MLKKLPFTFLFVTVMVLANTLAGTLGGGLPGEALRSWGLSLETLLNGEVFRLVTATFLSHTLPMFLRQIVFATTVIGAYEWLNGTRRAVLAFLSVDIIGTVLVFAFVIAPLARIEGGFDAELAALGDVGMSAGGFGLIGALCRIAPRPHLVLGLIAAAIGAKMVFDLDVIADSAHLICLGLGYGMQVLLDRRDSKQPPRT